MSEARCRPAALPMYSAHRPAVEAWWQALAHRLRDAGVADVPVALQWPVDLLPHWRAPGLLLSQACGFPLVHLLQGQVQVVGAFHYDAPGCEGVLNRSQVIVRDQDPARSLEDLRGRRLAINGTDSQSGYNSLRALLAAQVGGGRFFGTTITTGAHLHSVLAVRDGQADTASIDCVSLAGFRKHLPASTLGIRLLTQSAPYPGLPLVTAADTPAQTLQTLRDALADVCSDPRLRQVRADLLIQGFEVLSVDDYRVCSDMQAQADAAGVMIA